MAALFAGLMSGTSLDGADAALVDFSAGTPRTLAFATVPFPDGLRDELLALYRSASVALVTPLKDGMNLVAKEYCAAHVDNTGVLILSEFAGAMPELRTGAIVVHPYDELGMAEALRQALQMPNSERRRRMLRMRHQIQQADILRWRDHNFEQIQQPQQASTKLAA